MDSNAKRAAAEIWLMRKEQRLRASLNQGDMPVLGLYVDYFSPEDREYFRSTVLDSTNPVSSFIRGLARWPASSATFLTVHLVEGYGRSGNAEVYPYIQSALGLSGKTLNPAQRERLASAYRHACLELGLSVAPAGESARPLVDEYLRQVGVPVSYFPGLFEGFAKQALRLGIPDADDPKDLSAWQGFVEIPSTRPVLRRAVENDSEGYYARLFLRVSDFRDESECANAIERSAFRSFKSLDESIVKRKALIPSLYWRDDELGILLPSGTDRLWSIRVVGADGDSSSIAQIPGGLEPRFIPVGIPLPKRCEAVSGTLEFPFTVWESTADNQLVIFDHGGKYVARGRLGGDSIVLNPGTYTVVSRWLPPELGESSHSVSDEVALFASDLELATGQKLILARGPAEVQFATRQVPSLSWLGKSLVGMTGKEIYWGPQLAVRLSIPSDAIASASDGFELVVSLADGMERIIRPIVDPTGTLDEPIGAALNEMGLGLQRVRIRLRRRDIPNRALATLTGFVWPALASVSVGRLSGNTPAAFDNLNQYASDNILLDGSSLTYRDATQRFYRTVFKVASEEVAFQWPVPGVFIALAEAKDGVWYEKPLEQRAILQIRPGSRQQLKIYSASDGFLRLGTFTKELKSALFGGASIYLSALAEFLTPESQALKLEIPSIGYSEDLVRLVTPHQVIRFESRRSSDGYALEFLISGTLAELSIDAWDLLSGRRDQIRLEPDAISISGNPFQHASLATLHEGRFTLGKVSVPINEWEEGSWVLQIQARIDGRWGQLVNARGDVYAGGMRIPIFNDARSYVEQNTTQQEIHILGRIVDITRECYAIDSWNDLAWLEEDWRWLVEELAESLSKHAHALLSMIFRKVPETASESWVPVMSLAAELLDVFGLPYSCYRGFNGGGSVSNAVLGSTKVCQTRDDELFGEQFFSVMLMFGFENGGDVASGRAQQLRGFSSKRFAGLASAVGEVERRRIFTNMEWVPTSGDLLAVRHYWWALRRLETAFKNAAERNDFRKGYALRLASRVSAIGPGGIHPDLGQPSVAVLRSLGLMNPWMDEDDGGQERENLRQLVDVVSTMALGARLQARQPGVLGEIRESLCRQVGLEDRQLTAVLGFVLYVGVDLFIFYLGFWEFILVRDYDNKG